MAAPLPFHQGMDSLVRASIPEAQLIQPNDPVLSFIPSLKDLTCNAIFPGFRAVALIFFDKIHDVGNVTSDLRDPNTSNVLRYLTTKKISSFLEQESSDTKQILQETVIRCDGISNIFYCSQPPLFQTPILKSTDRGLWL